MTSVLVAFGTLFYAEAAAFQIWLMKQASKDSAVQVERLVGTTNAAIDKAVKASSEALTEALQQNKLALDASLSQSRASLDASTQQGKAALDATIAASHNDQRAWVGPTSFALPECTEGNQAVYISVGCGVRFGANIVNTGKTVATKYVALVRAAMAPTAVPFSLQCSPDDSLRCSFVPRDECHELHCSIYQPCNRRANRGYQKRRAYPLFFWSNLL